MLMYCINVLCASKTKNYFLFLFEYVRTRAAEKALPQGEQSSCVVLEGLDIKDGACPGYGCAWGSPSTTPAAPAFSCHPSAWHTKLAALGIRPHTALILAFQTAELCRKIMSWCVVGKGVILKCCALWPQGQKVSLALLIVQLKQPCLSLLLED